MDTLGGKIKKFRKRYGISQYNLELKMGMSSGHICKIENGKLNPTKEIIIDVANALKLGTVEIASLFGIDVLDISHLIEEATTVLSSESLNEVVDKTVNDLVLKMGYIASMILLADDNGQVHFNALTKSNISAKTIQCLNKPIDSLRLSLTRDLENLTVKVIRENRAYLAHHTYEYTVPAVSKMVADKIQSVTGDKSNFIFPLSVDSEAFGAIVYVKKIYDDFKNDKKTLEVITQLIAVAIHNAKKFEMKKS